MIELPEHVPDYRRLKVLYGIVLILLCGVVARLWYLQILKGPELSEQSDMRRTRRIRRAAARGTIEDSAGKPLATNRFRFVVRMIPDEIRRNSDVLARLATIVKQPVSDLTELLARARRLGADSAAVVDNADIPLISQIEEQQLDLPGVLITKDPERYYVDHQVCTHILGVSGPVNQEELDRLHGDYHGGDVIGKEGIEKTYELDLRGKDGGDDVAVSAHGHILGTIDEVKPIPGHTLRLTIDRQLQQTTYDTLMEELGRTGHAGSAVALDPRDGSVLALVSTPSYDLNSYRADYARLRSDKTHTPLIDRAVNSAYPCGSTFKLVTAAAGLETGSISPGSREYCPGYLKLGNHTFHCDKRSGHGSIDLENAIGASCDVYFWRVAQAVGIENLASQAKLFGLGQSTGIDLPAMRSAKGLIPTPAWKKRHRHDAWYPGDLLLTGIGQGFVKVSPIQLANYTAALANGGTLWQPQLVREVLDVSRAHPVQIRRLAPVRRGTLGLRADHRDAIVEGMRRALQKGGTAFGSAIPGLDVAGKTGTAQVSNKNDHSVFVCFAPIDNPKIAIAVLIENGGYGSDVAAPIARRMLNQFFHLHLDNSAVPIGRSHGID